MQHKMKFALLMQPLDHLDK